MSSLHGYFGDVSSSVVQTSGWRHPACTAVLFKSFSEQPMSYRATRNLRGAWGLNLSWNSCGQQHSHVRERNWQSKLQTGEQIAACMQGVIQRLQAPNHHCFSRTQYCKFVIFFPAQPFISAHFRTVGPQCRNLLSGKLDTLGSEGETPSKTESLAECIRRKLSICYPAYETRRAPLHSVIAMQRLAAAHEGVNCPRKEG